MDRRRFLLGSVSGGAVLAASPRTGLACDQQERVPLKETADQIGLEIGIAVSLAMMRDARSSAEIRRHAHLLVPEYALKETWLAEHSDREAKDLQGIARSHGLGLFGHTLHFEGRTPRVFSSLQEKKDHYTAHFEKIIADFPYVDSWEVTNEDHKVYTDDELPDPLTEVFKAPNLTAAESLEFLAHCMETARRLAPCKTLVINENLLYCHWSVCRNKRKDVLATLKYLEARNQLPDAIGLQSHLSSKARIEIVDHLGLDPLSLDTAPYDDVVDFINDVTAMGMDVHITELDVDTRAFSGTEDDVDKYHAAYVEAYLTAVLSNPAVTRLSFWGLHDHAKHEYRRGSCGEASDAKPCSRPTLFTADWKPKCVFDAVERAIQNAPKRLSVRVSVDAVDECRDKTCDPLNDPVCD